MPGPGAPDSRQRTAWDRMAREDAMFYVLSDAGPGGRDEDAFYETGRALASWALETAAPADRGLLVEIGCGLGRTLFAFAASFDRAIGFDIAPEMVARVNASPRRPANAEARETDGRALAGIADAAAGMVFSAIVFQHLPAFEAIEGYLAETARVLAPGGVALLHVDTRPQRLARRLAMALPDAVLPRVHRRGMRRHPRDPGLIRDAACAAGLEIVRELAPGSANHWLVLRRADRAQARAGGPPSGSADQLTA